MGKYLLRCSADQPGTPVDAASLERWIETARAAASGDQNAIEVLPGESVYIAERLAELIGVDRDTEPEGTP